MLKVLRLSITKQVYFFDETSTSAWDTQRKTWSKNEYSVTLPIQASRGRSITIMGAIGGSPIQWIYDTATRTNTDEVMRFFIQMFAQLRRTHDLKECVIVMDNHSVHRSKLMTEFFRNSGVIILFLPAYSSCLSPVEHMWASFKILWRREISKVKTKYNFDTMANDIKLICGKINFTDKILHSADKYFEVIKKK